MPTPPRPRDDATDAAEAVLAEALEQGFVLAGVAPARPSQHADHVRAWIAEQRHGEMHYLAEPLEVRLDPAALTERARSVLVVADAYPTELPGAADEPDPDGTAPPIRSTEPRYADAASRFPSPSLPLPLPLPPARRRRSAAASPATPGATIITR